MSATAVAGGPVPGPPVPDRLATEPSRSRSRWGWWGGLALVLAGSLALRLWGVKQGLPFAYNADEAQHFVPRAVGMFNHDLNPHYFNNPPAYTYLLHVVMAVLLGGRGAVDRAVTLNPTEVFVVCRVTAGVLGTVAVGLLYVAGSRLIDRRAGLLAAALLGVAFLPVFYSHLALNDVPTLAPLTLSLVGSAGVLRYGRRIDYVVAGAGLGVACATKYTGGIVILCLLAAAAVQYLAPGGQRSAVLGLGLAGGCALAGFLATDPYALLDYSSFRGGLTHQSTVSDDAAGKLGLTQHSGIVYYLWTTTWGLGWVPALAALGGALALWRDERRLVAVLVPAPVVFLLFMGLQGRYFGRWLLPVVPILCLIAAYGILELAEALARRAPALRPTLIAVAAVALCAEGLVHSVHSGLVLSRSDTRNLTRAWMAAHLPPGTRIVVEPVVPDSWAQDIGHPSPATSVGSRWVKLLTSRTQIGRDGQIEAGAGLPVNVESYETTLRPELIAAYEKARFCWVITGSTQSGRAAAAPRAVPGAVAYYRALGSQGTLAYRASPFAAHAHEVPFSFDFTFDYFPLAYHRPGPVMSIYHLTGGNCATPAVPATAVATAPA